MKSAWCTPRTACPPMSAAHAAHRLWRHARRELHDDMARYVLQLCLVSPQWMPGANDLGCVRRAAPVASSACFRVRCCACSGTMTPWTEKTQAPGKQPCRRSGAPHAGRAGIESRASSWIMREIAARCRSPLSSTLSTDDARNARAVQIRHRSLAHERPRASLAAQTFPRRATMRRCCRSGPLALPDM